MHAGSLILPRPSSDGRYRRKRQYKKKKWKEIKCPKETWGLRPD